MGYRIKDKFQGLYIVICFLVLSCGGGPEEENLNLTPEENLKAGWNEYRSGNYGAAIQAFERLSNGDTDNNSLLADAYNGLGWSYLGFSGSNGLNQNYITRALGKFDESINRDNTNADAYVGKACILLIKRSSQEGFNGAINALDKALKADTSYLYRHDYDSIADLYALKAQCYYYLGELERALSEVESILAIEKNNSIALTMEKLLY